MLTDRPGRRCGRRWWPLQDGPPVPDPAESSALHAAPGGERVLAAVRRLPELARRRVGQKPLAANGIDSELVTPAWKRVVFANTNLPSGAVDRDAYVVCVLEGLHQSLDPGTCSPARRNAGPIPAPSC